MAGYAHNNPVHAASTDTDGTRTADVGGIGRLDFYDPKNRMPAFAGLAKATRGFYAENEQGMTLKRAMEAARMNFEVRFHDDIEVTSLDGTGTTTVRYPFRGTYGIWPDGTTVGMGMVKSRYQLAQPADAGALGQHVMDEGDANVIAAGIYGSPMGSKTYLAFKLPEGFSIAGDHHDLYGTILNSYDGSTNIVWLLAPIRIACTNMAAMTFGRGVANRLTIQHSGDIEDKLSKAREALGLASAWTAEYKQAAEQLLATPLPTKKLDQFLEKLLPTPDSVSTDRGHKNWAARRYEIKEIITKSETCETGRNTAYSALLGVQEWADWVAATQQGGTDGAVARFTRILDGGKTEELKVRAANMLMRI